MDDRDKRRLQQFEKQEAQLNTLAWLIPAALVLYWLILG